MENPPSKEALLAKAQTVLGSVDTGALGITMPHEHLLADILQLAKEPVEEDKRAIYHAPLTMDIMARIRYFGAIVREDYILDDLNTAIDEATLFKQAGGGTIVDVTNIGMGRDPEGLVRIAHATGLNIVMGCSYYTEENYPPGSNIGDRSEDEIVDEIARDVFEGVDGTGVRAGIIGEVGCSWPMTDNERKVLRASGRAQRMTGAPLSVHTGRNPQSPVEIVKVLGLVDADLSRTIICHIDRTVDSKDILLHLAGSGCVLEYDFFGTENCYYPVAFPVDMPNDERRLRWLQWLIDEGHLERIVVSHDVCFKHRLFRYGGPGYSHIPSNVVPLMRRKGFDEDTIHTILVDNPARLLAFA